MQGTPLAGRDRLPLMGPASPRKAGFRQARIDDTDVLRQPLRPEGFFVNDQPAPRPQKPAPQLEHYPFRVQEIVRFGDLDPQGHVNQAVFSTYFESGRVAMFPDKNLGIG